MPNPVDVIAEKLSDGGAPNPDALAKVIWAALVEHGEKAWREDTGQLFTDGDYEEYECVANGISYARVLVLPMPEETNDA